MVALQHVFDPTVEAVGHAVRLRPHRLCETVLDAEAARNARRSDSGPRAPRPADRRPPVQYRAARSWGRPRKPGIRAALRPPGIDPGWITGEGGLRPDYWPERGGMDGFYIACLRRA